MKKEDPTVGVLAMSNIPGVSKILWWPLGLGAALSLTLVSALASSESSDGNSFLRPYTWESSFDKAGDASKSAEKELKSNVTLCDPAKITDPDPTKLAQLQADCERQNQKAKTYAEDVSSIRKTQYIFADLSRVSDVAAVGSIAATGYTELMQKDANQADSLKSVARIQETAGYASYASGAADLSMGTYAYLAQKQKLEDIKKSLSGKANGLASAANPQLLSKISNAAEQTKQAAYNHMLYGAGKMAVGYASMHLAKQNRKQAESLASLAKASDGNILSSYVAPVSSGAAPNYSTNPQIILPSSLSTNKSTGSESVGSGSYGGSGGGTSVLPSSPELRNPSSLNSGKTGGGSSGLTAGALGGAGGSASTEGNEEKGDAQQNTALVNQNYELPLATGGGASRYGGGGKSDSGSDPSISPFPGAQDTVQSKATGVNPNLVYSAALDGLDGAEMSSMAGVSAKNITLFQTMNLKYHEITAEGGVQGPNKIVEVRN